MKRKSKPVTFDAMVKFFMQTYDIPTKKDVDRLLAKLDRLELLLKSAGVPGRRGRPPAKKAGGGAKRRGRAASTATERVLQVIRNFKQGTGFEEIKILHTTRPSDMAKSFIYFLKDRYRLKPTKYLFTILFLISIPISVCFSMLRRSSIIKVFAS